MVLQSIIKNKLFSLPIRNRFSYMKVNKKNRMTNVYTNKFFLHIFMSMNISIYLYTSHFTYISLYINDKKKVLFLI